MTPKSVAVFLLISALSAGPALAQEARVNLLEAVDEAVAEIVREEAKPLVISTRQQPSEEKRREGLYKVIGGLSLVGVGAILAATSGEKATVTVESPFGDTTATASTRSTGKLVAGLAMVGGGALLAILGFKDRN